MKKSLVLASMMLALSFLMVGCPQAPQIDNSIPQGEMGKVVIKGNLHDDRDNLKSIDPNNVVDLYIEQARYLVFDFYPESGNEISFSVAIQDNGQYEGSFLLPAGKYYMFTTILDWKSDTLFYNNSHVQVAKGQETKMSIIFELYPIARFNFQINGLPGDYPEYGQATIITNAGQVFAGNYYQNYKGKSVGNEIIFEFGLPFDFDGADGAYLMLTDVNGEAQATELGVGFNIFSAAYGYFTIDYVEATELGSVDVSIGFIHYEATGGKG